jgi:DNA-binding transcriptional MerR regulator
MMPEDNQIAFSFDEDPIKKPVGLQKPLIIKTEVIDIPLEKIKPPKKSTKGRKSLKEMTASADLIEVPPDEILFQKLYYTIGTVAEMFKVNQSLIRFWENEFDILKPKKNRKGDRMFRPEDIKNLQLIHHLIREKKYTLEGAKDFLKNSRKTDEKFATIEALKKLKVFLLELKTNL